jgi:hypothetical protein
VNGVTRSGTYVARAFDRVISLLGVAFLNWFVLYVVALHEGAKEETCFQRCYPPAHIGWATPLIFLPTLLVGCAVVVGSLTPSGRKFWNKMRWLAVLSLGAVAIAVSLDPDLLSFVPPWHWLTAPSIG